MIKVDNIKKIIKITRGDSESLVLSAKDDEDNDYQPVQGDKLKFAVAVSWGKDPLFEIENIMNSSAETFWTINIEPHHTANLRFNDYSFDVQLTNATGPHTIIGKTDTVNPIFRVWGEVAR